MSYVLLLPHDELGGVTVLPWVGDTGAILDSDAKLEYLRLPEPGLLIVTDDGSEPNNRLNRIVFYLLPEELHQQLHFLGNAVLSGTDEAGQPRNFDAAEISLLLGYALWGKLDYRDWPR